MAAKAKIYLEKDHLADADLINQLRDAVERLEIYSRAVKPINKGGHPCGFGVDKTQRSIAADEVLSIAKAIKSKGGW